MKLWTDRIRRLLVDLGRKLEAVTVIPREVATQTLAFGSMRRSKPLKDETEFLIAGPKLYEFGSMDGSFPRVGRLDGDQGGVWCHPIKLVDGFIHTEGDAPLSGRFWLPGEKGADVTMNGRTVNANFQPMQPAGMERPAIGFDLAAGAELRIEQEDRGVRE